MSKKKQDEKTKRMQQISKNVEKSKAENAREQVKAIKAEKQHDCSWCQIGFVCTKKANDKSCRCISYELDTGSGYFEGKWMSDTWTQLFCSEACRDNFILLHERW